ncbi:MAG: RAMP superfamily protein [Candidatus Scalindua brodae]|uniref:RAMP superfamily protein n=1 Tax=Candidatus Scalindua brodae TaxID=237368 RepID=A0A0B0EMU9_9BACT|nr:MAG: RAMP superfamily protein [Candidatus Scalindua brodae]
MANPYDFVPIAEVKRGHILTTHGQFNNNLLSGYIQCALTVISPLCIKSLFVNPGEQDIYLPGSSLKGMIRTVMETLYGGCGFNIEKDYYYKKTIKPNGKRKEHVVKYFVNNCKYPDGKYEDSKYISCDKHIDAIYKLLEREEKVKARIMDYSLCPVCSLFGITTEPGLSFAGRLSFEDTETQKVHLEKYCIPQPDTPRVYRRSFYFKNPGVLPSPGIKKGEPTIKTFEGGEYNGRKFYLHSKNGKVYTAEKQNDSDRDPVTVFAAPINTSFAFKLHFKNLSEYELGSLLFALDNSKNRVYNKLGYGKPVGMGSAKITVNTVKTLGALMYKRFECAVKHDDYNFLQCLENYIESSKILETTQYKKLVNIWGMQGKELSYPDIKFFGNENNANTTIGQFNSGNYGKKKEYVVRKPKQPKKKSVCNKQERKKRAPCL